MRKKHLFCVEVGLMKLMNEIGMKKIVFL
jgi:hypothetical protein